jgi:hypothetical protein
MTATSWGWGIAEGIEEKTICKLSYQVCRSLVNNDEVQVLVPMIQSPLNGSIRGCMSLHDQTDDRPAKDQPGGVHTKAKKEAGAR